MRLRSIRAIAEFSGAALLALLLGAAPAQAAGPDGVALSDAWVRLVVPARPAAAYFTLTNGSDQPATLTGVTSPGCGMASLHQTVNQNGVDSMQAVQSVDVPAHGSLSFAPGSYHVMCMSPTSDLKVGADVPFTLSFSDGSAIEADFPVKGPAGK